GPVLVSGFAHDMSAGPSDEASQTLAFTATVLGHTGNLTFDVPPAIDAATGNLTYTPAANANGTATIQVVLHDNGSGATPNINASAAQTFTIPVNAVNDAPSFTMPADPDAVDEDSDLVTVNGFATDIAAGPSDESGQTLSFAVTVVNTTGNLA